MTTKHLVAWAATFLVMIVIDLLWLGVIAKNLYAQAMGDLMAQQPRLGIAALFYLMYPIGLVIFAVLPGVDAGSVARAGVLGALFGLFAYATYDLTNLAVVRNWPVALSFIDIAWGTLVSAVSAGAGAAVVRWFVAR
ncbi:DUF2177 family protein [Variovorax ginsengisoli]|uniref:Membrane protein n=1 Tax=Variovorax ginsengisoli TaxID=363844 RepID=A0ABT9S8B6_9BURK|nr:DUF2177 family protein [Variovorax ginsengisoli]MDP9900591.1 putative membrane protein [Variovorax ginsengisoli]